MQMKSSDSATPTGPNNEPIRLPNQRLISIHGNEELVEKLTNALAGHSFITITVIDEDGIQRWWQTSDFPDEEILPTLDHYQQELIEKLLIPKGIIKKPASPELSDKDKEKLKADIIYLREGV